METRSLIILCAFCIIAMGAVVASYHKYMTQENIVFETEGFTLEEEE